MIWQYYVDAFSRSLSAAWAWATGQGILLTWLLAVALAIASVVYALARASIKYHSWAEAKKHVDTTLGDFFSTAVISSLIAFCLLFAIFFVRDAPEQVSALTKSVVTLKDENAKAAGELKNKYEAEIGQLNKKIVELGLRLDDRDAQRRVREEHNRLREERINSITTLIASGNLIAKTFEEKNDKDQIKQQYIEWERGALDRLSSATFDTSFLAPFGSARGTPMMLINHDIEGNGWYSLLEGKIAVLNNFLIELRNQ
jgi:hypothetical protein